MTIIEALLADLELDNVSDEFVKLIRKCIGKEKQISIKLANDVL